MSLITTAELWNPDDYETDNTENKKTTRRTPSQLSQSPLLQNVPINATMTGPQRFPDTNNNVGTIMDKINNITVKNAGDNLMKFNPISPPEIQNKKNTPTNAPQSNQDSSPQTQRNMFAFNGQNLGDAYSTYKTSYPPTISNISTDTPLAKLDDKSNNNINERINYMIRMLEEQKTHKTEHILEEFLLYGLVGVFVIYVVDSFNRTANKYTR